VLERMRDGQLDECDLTMADLARVKASFVKTLLSMMHSRIKYQKVVEAPSVAAPAVHDGLTVVMESPYSEGGEVRKRPTRKPPPASAA